MQNYFSGADLATTENQLSLQFLWLIIISIQPEGRVCKEPEPSQATGMALAHCILGSFLGGRLPLLSPTFRRSHFRL